MIKTIVKTKYETIMTKKDKTIRRTDLHTILAESWEVFGKIFLKSKILGDGDLAAV